MDWGHVAIATRPRSSLPTFLIASRDTDAEATSSYDEARKLFQTSARAIVRSLLRLRRNVFATIRTAGRKNSERTSLDVGIDVVDVAHDVLVFAERRHDEISATLVLALAARNR